MQSSHSMPHDLARLITLLCVCVCVCVSLSLSLSLSLAHNLNPSNALQKHKYSCICFVSLSLSLFSRSFATLSLLHPYPSRRAQKARSRQREETGKRHTNKACFRDYCYWCRPVSIYFHLLLLLPSVLWSMILHSTCSFCWKAFPFAQSFIEARSTSIDGSKKKQIVFSSRFFMWKKDRRIALMAWIFSLVCILRLEQIWHSKYCFLFAFFSLSPIINLLLLLLLLLLPGVFLFQEVCQKKDCFLARYWSSSCMFCVDQ